MMLWLKFNIYSVALFMVATAIVVFLFACEYLQNLFVVIILSTCSLLMYLKALDIFAKYGYKKNLSKRLVQKSKKHFDQRYFLPYMDSPCMRSVVYFTLCEIDRADEWKAIKKRAFSERDLFEKPRIVTIVHDNDGHYVFLAHDRVTGEVEEI